jgi:hypothetical protein
MHSNQQGRAAVLFTKFLAKRIVYKYLIPLLVGDAEALGLHYKEKS